MPLNRLSGFKGASVEEKWPPQSSAGLSIDY